MSFGLCLYIVQYKLRQFSYRIKQTRAESSVLKPFGALRKLETAYGKIAQKNSQSLAFSSEAFQTGSERTEERTTSVS